MLNTINISQIHKYNVETVIDGSMGSIYIIKRDKKVPLLFEDKIIQHSDLLMDESKYIYREKLAAKTIKCVEYNEQFIRELNIWINIKDNGSVPLLKIIKDKGMVFGIMPFYKYNLQEYILNISSNLRLNTLKYLIPCIECLQNVNEKFGIIHLDLKPQNILVQIGKRKIEFKLSDWGIANIHTSALKNEFNADIFDTRIGEGTVPFMAPERLEMKKPDFKSDVFSLGLILYYILFKKLPYSTHLSIEEQILSHQYYEIILKDLFSLQNTKLQKLISEMVHPSIKNRCSSYQKIIKQLKKI